MVVFLVSSFIAGFLLAVFTSLRLLPSTFLTLPLYSIYYLLQLYSLETFNCRHTLWGDSLITIRGLLQEQFILVNDLSILKTGSPTHFDLRTQSLTCTQLSLCSPSIFLASIGPLLKSVCSMTTSQLNSPLPHSVPSHVPPDGSFIYS